MIVNLFDTLTLFLLSGIYLYCTIFDAKWFKFFVYEDCTQPLVWSDICAYNVSALLIHQNLIREFDGIHIISAFLSDPATEVKIQTLNALNNLCMNIQNQEQIKVRWCLLFLHCCWSLSCSENGVLSFCVRFLCRECWNSSKCHRWIRSFSLVLCGCWPTCQSQTSISICWREPLLFYYLYWLWAMRRCRFVWFISTYS